MTPTMGLATRGYVADAFQPLGLATRGYVFTEEEVVFVVDFVAFRGSRPTQAVRVSPGAPTRAIRFREGG